MLIAHQETHPDMRGPNEIDFWRGFALLTIFVDHVPGLWFESYTMRQFGLSDAAELFVFLAGWSMRLLMNGRKEPMSLPGAVMRLETRALTIFFAQLIITQMALALTAADSGLTLRGEAGAVLDGGVPLKPPLNIQRSYR
jgi:hypothetical protein